VAVFVGASQPHRTGANPCGRGSGGDGGIRTLDTLLTYTHFPGERLRPLGHVSTCFSAGHALGVEFRFRKCMVVVSVWLMKKHALTIAVSILFTALLSSAAPADAAKKKAGIKAAMPPPVAAVEPTKAYPSPPEIVAAAPASDWVEIAPSDLLVMDLAPDTKGKPRRVVIQLMPAPFSQGWIGNIRKLAAAKFWDGTAIVRVQDNYVTQWGDPTEKKALPDGLAVVPQRQYVVTDLSRTNRDVIDEMGRGNALQKKVIEDYYGSLNEQYKLDAENKVSPPTKISQDHYSDVQGHYKGWAISLRNFNLAPTHCYGMVGVGRNLSPDTGTGAELYTVIGHAPRHLDRNIALVGRIIEGMEHMSSLPRGTGALGFYEKPEERTAILSVRLMSEMETDKTLPAYEYLSTESESFAKYADARANRRDPFFITPAGGADICNIPVPVRRRK
jgi:cyclophilin family peptidyl-prolyl cis-trans isomerase